MSDAGIAATITAILAAIGLTFHITIIVLKFRLKSLQHTFFLLFTSLAVGDAGCSAIFLFWCVPVIIWQIPCLNYGSVHIPSFIAVTCFHVGAFSAFVISINRFIAVWFPTKYKIIFDSKNVKHFIVGIWIVAVLNCLPFLFPPCKFYFNGDFFIWKWGTDNCSLIFSIIDGNILMISLFALVMAINWLTFFKVRLAR